MPNCIICSADNHKPLMNVNDICRKRKFKYHLCLNCGAVFQVPLLTAQDIKRIYTNFPKFSGERLNRYFKGKEGKAEERVKWLKENLDLKGKNILEIGAGAGSLLYLLKKDNEVIGVEIDRFMAVECLRRYGIHLFPGYSHISFTKNSLDLAIIISTIEHLLNPVETVENIWLHLKPGGYLYIETPNFHCAHSADFSLSHTCLFSYDLLRQVVENCGFEIIEFNIQKIWHYAGKHSNPKLQFLCRKGTRDDKPEWTLGNWDIISIKDSAKEAQSRLNSYVRGKRVEIVRDKLRGLWRK